MISAEASQSIRWIYHTVCPCKTHYQWSFYNSDSRGCSASLIFISCNDCYPEKTQVFIKIFSVWIKTILLSIVFLPLCLSTYLCLSLCGAGQGLMWRQRPETRHWWFLLGREDSQTGLCKRKCPLIGSLEVRCLSLSSEHMCVHE